VDLAEPRDRPPGSGNTADIGDRFRLPSVRR